MLEPGNWPRTLRRAFALALADMERIHSEQLATIFTGLASAFGRDEALAQAQHMLDRALLGRSEAAPQTQDALVASPAVHAGVLDTRTKAERDGDLASATVQGLPDGYSWDQAPVEVKLAKGALRSAMAKPHGVVLRHEDSVGGDLYYAVYDHGSKTFQVPAGYQTSRGRAAEITVNGAYRWLLVGVARAVAPRSRRTAKGESKATLTLPKWRGREYEPCHEEMAHSGNVRAGTLVRDIKTGTLDYVAECDGRTALIERENGDLDDYKLSAQPSKVLRVVGYSSQYAREVAARG